MNDQLEINAVTEAIIGAAIEVHRQLGPGLLESVYRKCVAYEFRKCGHEATSRSAFEVPRS